MAPEITGALTTAVSGGAAAVTLEWTATPEATSYSVQTDTGTGFVDAVTGVTETTAVVSGLVPGSTVDMRVTAHRGGDATAGGTTAVAVSTKVERWLIADVGSNAGSGGSVTENADGTIVFDAKESSTKIASSEDGFQYFYTQIDPTTENFTFSATFEVTDASTADTQSGFGIIAIDDLVTEQSSHRYFNSAGAVVSRCMYGTGSGEWHNGTPCARFVTGYSDATDVSSPDRDEFGSEILDLDWRPGVTGAKFQTGDVYAFTLRKSNTGFHAIWTRDGEVMEAIEYEPELLLQQNPDAFWVGMAAARKIVVTVTEWDFSTVHPDDDPAQPRPTEEVPVRFDVDVTRTTPHTTLDIPLVSNMHGTGQILDAAGTVVGEATLAPGDRPLIPVTLEPGENAFTARLLVADDQPQLEDYERPEVVEVEVPLTITVDRFGTPGQSIWVTPDGTPDGDGTKTAPLDVHTAVAFAQPGQQIVLESGTYTPDRAIIAHRGRDGTAEAPITLMSEPDGRAVFDLSGSEGGGIILRGDWWHVYDIEVHSAKDKQKAMLVQGHHNVVERVESHHNGDTGIQISGSEAEPRSLWPTHNLVVSSVSHNNADAGRNDADGFAAKLAVGEGNVFRHDIAYNNIDDGWDLYAKSTTGSIGVVVIEDSVAFDNGFLEADPADTGEGNGFKLGGESMPGAHLLRDAISYGNLATGVTSNSGPDVRLENVTSVGNQRGVRLETNASVTAYEATGVLSGPQPDLDALELKQADVSLLTDPTNVWNIGDPSPVSDAWFVSTDTESLRPEIAPDGSIEMHGLFELTDAAAPGVGAVLSGVDEPTVIDVLPEVTVPLANEVAPAVVGDAVKGRTLTAHAGTWTRDDATFSYEWLRDGEPIPGRIAADASYKVRGGDVGHTLAVRVTATVDGQDPVVATSAAVLPSRQASGSRVR